MEGVRCRCVTFTNACCREPSWGALIGLGLMSQPDVSRGLSGLCVVSAAWRVVSGVRYRVPIICIFVAARFLFSCSPYGDPYFLCLPVYKETIVLCY